MVNFDFGQGTTKFLFTINDKNEVRISAINKDIFDNDFERNYLEDMQVLCELEVSGRGNCKHGGDRHFSCSESVLLKYKSHEIIENSDYNELVVVQFDDICEVETHFVEFKNTNTIRVFNIITNTSDSVFTVEYISSLVLYGLFGKNIYDDVNLFLPSNGWYSECQWKKNRLSDLGVFSFQDLKSMKKYCISSTGSWSTKSYLPMGILEQTKTEEFCLWQIESNGSWTYELGDICRSVSLHLSGPSLQENGCSVRLSPNEKFETVKCAITFSDSLNGVIDNITLYRRHLINKSEADKKMPTIFNEYMFASGNCPSIDTIEKLAPIAKNAGVEYFVIDCGWHDEVTDPFYHVGKWQPSKLKYPNGFKNAIDRIRSFGLKAGLWMEPEVVGALGDASSFWDEDCYLKRFGKRIMSSSRYFLDFCNKKVTDKLDSIVDGLIDNYGIAYFKFDYNCDIGIGDENHGSSLGEGLLLQNRAVINWISGIKKRHPDLILECCASGGNRMDYLSLSYSDMVSSSDQTNCYLYPYIVGNMLSAVLPEQAAVWSYPVCFSDKSKITEESVIINMINSLLGRMHLASKLYELSDEQFALVKEGVQYYDYLKKYKSFAMPYFPNGFCSDKSEEIVVGLKTEKKIFLFVYGMKTKEINIKIPFAINKINIGYPKKLKTETNFYNGVLTVKLPETKTARIIEIELK